MARGIGMRRVTLTGTMAAKPSLMLALCGMGDAFDGELRIVAARRQV